MVNEVDNKFTWVIKHFSSLKSEIICSDRFVIGGCKWLLRAYPRESKVHYLSLFLKVADHESLPLGWRREVTYSLKLVNQFSDKSSIMREAKQSWFDQKSPSLGFLEMIPLTKLYSKDVGFLVNDELKIVVEIHVLQVVGESDVSEGSSQPMKKIKMNDSDLHNEMVDVNGFQVSTSQVATVRCIFERHADFASQLRSNNQLMKSTYMNVLLGIIETLCKLPEHLSDDDLDEASAAVSYVTKVGFKVDWLEKKLEEVKEKKNIFNTGKAKLQQMEEELEILNKKCLDMKDLVEKQNVAFSFDDVV